MNATQVRKRALIIVAGALFVTYVASVAFGQTSVRTGEPNLTFEATAPDLVLSDMPWELQLHLEGDLWPEETPLTIEFGDESTTEMLRLRDDRGALLTSITVPVEYTPEPGTHGLDIRLAGMHAQPRLRVVPGWLAILPPLLAIFLAVVFREVILALASGVWLGATFVHGYDPVVGLLRTADRYAVGALADSDHASIAIFSLILGGMIGVISRSGGAQGMAALVTRVAKTRLTGALATWLMGLAIFFDDYSNSLLVGTTMRPITDRLKLSREKLAFIVDATAAPVSSFAVVSSWVGVEVGYIADQYAALGLEGDPYMVFLESIPYRFYPLLMLWFGLMLILTQRDFGPMLTAERRAMKTGQLVRPGSKPASDFEAKELATKKDTPSRWINAVAPLIVVVVVAMLGMYATGYDGLIEARNEAGAAIESSLAAMETGQDLAAQQEAKGALAEARRSIGLLDVNVRNIFGKASSLKALLWAAFLGGLLAMLLAVGQRILTVREAMDAWVAGVRSIAMAVMILVLAWSLGEVCSELNTAQFVIQAIGSWLSPSLLPAVVFAIAAGVSFATGTSWGTMGILFPLVIPLAHEMAPADPVVVLSSVASILSGSVWGDHCSPISDTTIMSSMASSCDHVDHVRTQLPYALAVGGVSLLFGEVATGMGLYGPWVGLLLGAIALFLIARFVGKSAIEDPEPAAAASSAEVPPAASGGSAPSEDE